MSKSDSSVNTGRELIRQILPMMSQHTEDFQPKSYALWYAYVLGTHPALKSAIDKRISQGERLSDQATLDLYAHHLIEKAESQVADAQDKLMRVLAKAHDQMHSAGSETSRFNEHLLEFGTALGSPEDLDKLKAEVETMAGETSRIHATIDRLVDSVRESQAEVARLSLELTRARDQANTDALTGLANRRAFDDAILQFCRGHGSRGLCLIMMDIDHFKKVNDNYGHPYGDLVIKTVASIIHANVRGRDLAARYGGEEFAVLLLDTHESDAAMVADRIRDQVSLAAIRDVDGTQAKQITVSAGVAEHDSREPPEGLTGRADRALYRSKTGGRNRVTRASG